MFDTAPIRWLQSFDSESFIAFMRFVSLLGQQVFFVPLIIIVLFGIHRWKGLVLIETVLWTVILTTVLKELLALPRPSDVDSLVRILDPAAMDQSLFGFPSGHCSLTVATWGTLALLFRKRWLLVPGIIFALLMPLSRMYLGRHFAGDVLGGTALGFLVIGVLFVWRSRLLGPLAAGATPGPESRALPGCAPEYEPGTVPELGQEPTSAGLLPGLETATLPGPVPVLGPEPGTGLLSGPVPANVPGPVSGSKPTPEPELLPGPDPGIVPGPDPRFALGHAEHAPASHYPALLLIGLLVLPSILLFLPFGIHSYAGTLLGFGAGYLLGKQLVVLDSIREPWKKGATVLVAVVIYLAAGWVFKEAVQPSLGVSATSGKMLREFVVTMLMVWLTPMTASLFFVRSKALLKIG